MIVEVPSVIRRSSMLVPRAVEEINQEVNDRNVEQTEHEQKAGVNQMKTKKTMHFHHKK